MGEPNTTVGVEATTALVDYRLTQLERQFADVKSLIQETHDAVTRIHAKMGNGFTFQCNVHQERMAAIEQRLVVVEDNDKTRLTEINEIKKFIWKVTGGLGIILLLANLFVSPLITESLNKEVIRSTPTHIHMGTNEIPIHVND